MPDQPAPRRKRRPSAEIAERLIRAAGEAFESGGYAGATTAAIARRAEVTEAQLFRSFGSKEALFRAAVYRPLERHFDAFHQRHVAELAGGDLPPETVHAYVVELLDFMRRHSRLLFSLAAARTHGSVGDRLDGDDGLAAYFDRGAALIAGRLPPAARARAFTTVRFAFVTVLGSVLFRPWLFPPGEPTDEALVEFILHGVGAPPAGDPPP